MSRMESSSPVHRNSKGISAARLCALLLAGVLIFMIAGILFGSVSISLSDLLHNSLSSSEKTILLQLRLPRMLACLLGGAALASGGLIIQSVLANPLAAPNIIGIHTGAGLCTALACALLPNTFNVVPAAAFAGALMASFLVLALARKTRASRTTLLLAGLAVSSIFSAMTDLVITFFPDALIGYIGFRMGSLAGVSFEKLAPGAIVIIVGLIAACLCSTELELLSLGNDHSGMLGLDSTRWSRIFIVISALLAGGTISFGGLIGFIGLIVPQIIRRSLKPGTSGLMQMICVMLAGSLLLMMADLGGRILFAPYEIPCGILLSLAGGPYFLYLLLRNRRKSLFSGRKTKRNANAERVSADRVKRGADHD